MKISLVAIGNSRGVRLPKAVLDQCAFTDAAELTIENGRLIITPVTHPRASWAGAFGDAAKPLSEEDREWLDAPLTQDRD